MIRNFPGLLSGFLFRIIALSATICAALILAACNDTEWPDREPTVIENVEADSLVFWPPRAYALPGDVLITEVLGLKRVYTCSRVLLLEGETSDSTAGRYMRLNARVELPAVPDCPLSTGLDTVLEMTAPAAGLRAYLQTADGTVTDSLLVINGIAEDETFLHVTRTADTLRPHGIYTLRDSTAGHPRRVIYSASLPTCEIMQAAVFSRVHGTAGGGDTLTVRLRILRQTSLPSCTGTWTDTVEVVEDRYGFP